MPSKWAWNKNYKGGLALWTRGGEVFTDCHHMWLWWFWRWSSWLAPVSIRWAWECCWWRRMGLQVLWYLTFQLTWWPELSISGTNVVPASTCVVEADQIQNGSGVFHHHHMDSDHPVLGHQTQDLLKVGPSTSQPISFKIYLIFKQMLNISDLQAKAEHIWSSGSRNCNYTCKRGGPCKVTFGGHPRAGRPICLQRGWFGHLVIILSSWTSPLRYVKGSAVIQRTVKDDIYSWGCP